MINLDFLFNTLNYIKSAQQSYESNKNNQLAGRKKIKHSPLFHKKKKKHRLATSTFFTFVFETFHLTRTLEAVYTEHFYTETQAKKKHGAR